MYGLDILIQKVLLLTVLVLLGVILRKSGKADGRLARGFADTVIYLAQPAMIINSFLEAEYSFRILMTALCVLGFSLVFHAAYFGISLFLYKKAPDRKQTILRFSTVFTNAGFMGIPLIRELISPVAAIYATFYVMAFNMFSWSLGCYMFTKDRKYISVKKMFVNPATIPTYIGLILFLIGGLYGIPAFAKPAFDSFITPFFKDNVLFLLSNAVLPLSMMMIGIRLAEADFREIFKDKQLPVLFAVRLVAIPLGVMAVMKLVSVTGILPEWMIGAAASVLVISSSTPSASVVGVFSEMFDGDAVYASKVVSASTLVSMLTMPLISALLLTVM